jgi:hypothetical protein
VFFCRIETNKYEEMKIILKSVVSTPYLRSVQVYAIHENSGYSTTEYWLKFGVSGR